MNKSEALRILEAKLASIEREHNAELSDDEGQRELIDNKAEARTLAAVFDFFERLQNFTHSFAASHSRALSASKTDDAFIEFGAQKKSAISVSEHRREASSL
jgi:hypothetical protein